MADSVTGTAGTEAKLLVDLEAVEQVSAELRVPCSYYYHPANDGYAALRETATFALFCRHCAEGTCVKACPKEALTRGEDGIVRRSTMLCVKCNSCVLACPFGTIREALIPFASSRCDYCVGRLGPGESPKCVEAAGGQLVRFGRFSEDESQGIHALNDVVLVKVQTWKKDAGR